MKFTSVRIALLYYAVHASSYCIDLPHRLNEWQPFFSQFTALVQ